MNAALAELQNPLHVSHGQVFSYLACSLKYRFQYVERRPAERLSISLPFGKAIHSALERYYLGLQQGMAEALDVLEDLFAEQLTGELQATDVPVLFKKETPDLASAITMGRNMLQTFHAEVDLGGAEVVAVELPPFCYALLGRVQSHRVPVGRNHRSASARRSGQPHRRGPQDRRPAEEPGRSGRRPPADGLQLLTHRRRQGACPLQHPTVEWTSCASSRRPSSSATTLL